MRRTTAVVATVLLSAAVLGFASPAQADHPACPANRFCLFEHDNYEGGRAVFNADDSDLRNNFWPGTNRTVHNNASSMINNKGVTVGLRSNAVTCDGDSYTAAVESVDTDFSDNSFDNEASCVQIN